jgi:hypothetical protein
MSVFFVKNFIYIYIYIYIYMSMKMRSTDELLSHWYKLDTSEKGSAYNIPYYFEFKTHHFHIFPNWKLECVLNSRYFSFLKVLKTLFSSKN